MKKDGRSIVGIHTRAHEPKLNQGVRITKSVKDEIESWIKLKKAVFAMPR